MDYVVVKWVHVLSSTVLFGAGVGSAFHLFASSLRGHVGGAAGSARNVVVADWLLTTPSAIVQPVSGLWLLHRMQIPLSTPWVRWSLALYAVAIGCWLPVLWIQIRMRNEAVAAERAQLPLPPAYRRLFHWWTALGCAAFVPFVLIFWLMVAKRLPWAT
jgi:uncharacterized membrane protein